MESLHVAGAVEIARWSVTCERGWFSGCGTQLTARMLGRRVVGFYVCIFWKMHDSYLMPIVPMSDHGSLIENVNQSRKESPPRHPGCELRSAAMEPAGFAGHRPLGVLRRASDAGVLHQRSLRAHASKPAGARARVRHVNRTGSAVPEELLITH